QYSAALEEVSKKKQAEDESDASDIDGGVVEGEKQDSDIDVEDNPVHDKYS
ncbi:hypothetical protein AVEN_129081-1, partial [Araneus ventricosus]